jgi:protein involved in polysaccharide export with SLBB domain
LNLRNLLAVALLATIAAQASAADLPADIAEKIDAARQDKAASRMESLSPTAIAGPVDPDRYRVGPGDRFLLVLTGGVSKTVELTVSPEGTLTLPDVGTLDVSGATLRAVRARALETLRREYHGVSVDLRLDRPRVFRVYVTGRVKRPGGRDATGASRVSDLITPDDLLEDASTRRIEIRHPDGAHLTADLGRFLLTGDASGLPYLGDGDVVNVPVASSFAYAFGAVATPGRYELLEGDSLGTLLRMAGGTLPSAVRNRALWLHWGAAPHPDSLWLDLDAASFPSGALGDGDRLFVYFKADYRIQHSVTVTGEVARPGDYPIEEGRTRLSDVVAQAGGFLPAADLSAIRVRRANTDASEHDIELERLLRLSRNDLTLSEYEGLQTRLAARREDYRVDFRNIEGKDGASNLLLHSGDVVRAERLIAAIRIDGQVNQPAILTYRSDLRLADYIRQAGGFTSRAWKGKIRITRAVSGQTLPVSSVDALDPGDFIWVPEKPDVTVWQQTREVLTAIAQVATIVIAIRSVR